MTLEPIPYFFESINRNAIIVRPKKLFFDWINSVASDDMELITEKDENTIYLIREMDSNDQIRNWVRRNFDVFFINELNDWCTDEEEWPKKRTYKMFADWFDIEAHSMILDLEETEISKD